LIKIGQNGQNWSKIDQKKEKIDQNCSKQVKVSQNFVKNGQNPTNDKSGQNLSKKIVEISEIVEN
jgi:hypothetical protein